MPHRNIKRPGLLLIIFMTALTTSLAQCPQLVWQDEFNGTALDLTKWTPQIGNGCDIGLCGWGNNELQYYTDRSTNLLVSGGVLQITARKERIQSNQYTSGRIRSLNKGEWTYGRMEARMKMPVGQGIWPAFWMLPTDEVYGGWPQSGEIDIMEYLGHQSNTIYGTIHYGQPWPNNKSTGGKYLLPVGGFNDDFHVVAIEWEPNVMRWYVDGILYATRTSADLSPERWPFDQRFHFLLNLAVGGNWPGNPDATTVFPQTLTVDYVRVYATGFPNISGPDQVQANQTGIQYSVPSSPGASYTWTVPAGAAIRSGQGSNTITVDWGSNQGIVKVAIGQSCGTNEYSKNVYIKPTLTYTSTFENFDDKRNITFQLATGTFQQAISNPDPSGVNTSAKVGSYLRNSSEQYDVLVYGVSSITDASQYSTRSKRFFMDVRTNAPPNTLIFIQLENSATATPSNFPTGRHSRYVAFTTKQNEWERLEFDLDAILDSSVPHNAVDKLIILFNSNSFTGHNYYFDNFDTYAVGSGAPDTQAPTAPANLVSTAKTDVSVSLSWNASTDNVGVTGYDIFKDGVISGSSSTTTHTVTGLSPSTAYAFTVRAKDAAGNISPASNSLSVTTNPSAGTTIKIEAENYSTAKGVTTVACLDTDGGLNVASIDNRDYVEYTVNIPVAGTYRVDFRVASAVSTGRFDFKKGQSVLASLTVPNTGGSQAWQTISTNVQLAAGTQKFRIAATATGFSLNWLSFNPGSASQSVLASPSSEASRELEYITMYPNPARGSVTIATLDSRNLKEVMITSETGVANTYKPDAPQLTISTEQLHAGLYIVKIRTATSFTVKKLLIE
jgi:beta-glucanase (GH16 family)